MAEHLEEKVSEIIDGMWDIDTVVALLVSYNLDVTYNHTSIARAMLRSMHFFEDSEFDLLLAQVPLSIQESENLKPQLTLLLELDDLLHEARFDKFWALWEEKKKTLPEVKNFEEGMRFAIATALSHAVVTISESDASEFLGVKDISKILDSFKATVKDSKVTFPSTSLNDIIVEKKDPATLETVIALIKK